MSPGELCARVSSAAGGRRGSLLRWPPERPEESRSSVKHDESSERPLTRTSIARFNIWHASTVVDRPCLCRAGAPRGSAVARPSDQARWALVLLPIRRSDATARMASDHAADASYRCHRRSIPWRPPRPTEAVARPQRREEDIAPAMTVGNLAQRRTLPHLPSADPCRDNSA
jgi:hypothetical protein